MNTVQNSAPTTRAGGYSNIAIGFPWKILVFSAIVFFFTIFIYLGLKFGYNSYLTSRDKNLDKRIDQLATVVSMEDQQEFITFYSQLVNLKEVLKKHTVSSRTFELLEKHTISSIYYTSAKVLPKDRKLEISGRATSIDSFVEQLYVFDNSSDFRAKATVTQMGFDQGRTIFTITLYPREEVFQMF